MAHDCFAIAERLDRTKDGRQQTGRRLVPFASSAAFRTGNQAGAFAATGRVAAQLPAGGTLRRPRKTKGGVGGTCARGLTSHGRKPACERRFVTEGFEASRLSELRGRGSSARHSRSTSDS